MRGNVSWSSFTRSMSGLSLVFTILLLGPDLRGEEWFVGQACDASAPLGSRDNPFGSIQGAIDETGVTADDEIIVLPGPIGQPYERATVGKKLWIRAEAGPLVTWCEGFEVDTDIQARITGFTIKYAGGPGILIADGLTPVTVENCIIAGCSASGVEVVESSNQDGLFRLRVVNSTVHGNSADGLRFRCFDAFGIIATNSATVQNSIISGNEGLGVNFLNRGGAQTCPTRGTVDIGHSFVARADDPEMPNRNGMVHCLDIQEPCPPLDSVRVRVCNAFADPPDFANADTGDLRATNYSHNGNPAKADLNPDGTRNTVGAFGGPQSAGFDPSAPGPQIHRVIIEAVADGKVRLCVRIKE